MGLLVQGTLGMFLCVIQIQGEMKPVVMQDHGWAVASCAERENSIGIYSIVLQV